jgi:hypothetical protein
MVLTKIQDMDIKVVFICPDNSSKYIGRKYTMLWLLQTLGFKHIEHFKSDDIPYPRCLVKATRDILQKYIDEPVLLLEDDVAYTDHCLVDIPDDADAFYLGLSESGAAESTHPFRECDLCPSQFESISSLHTIQIKNMLSAHAVLYLTRRYKEAVIHAMNRALEHNWTNDISLARLQSHFCIYGSKIPVFYQSRAFNLTVGTCCNVEDQTNIQIEVHDDGKCVPVRRYGGKTAYTKYTHE